MTTSRPDPPAEPRTFLTPGQPWPSGTMRADAPSATIRVAGFVTRTMDALVADGIDARTLADRADIEPTLLEDVLNGDRWPSLWLVVEVSYALGRPNLFADPLD